MGPRATRDDDNDHDHERDGGLRATSSSDMRPAPAQHSRNSSESIPVSHENTEPARTQAMHGHGMPGGSERPGQVPPNQRGSNERDETPEPRYDVPNSWANLDEVADAGPVQNLDEGAVYEHESLEDARKKDAEYDQEGRTGAPEDAREKLEPAAHEAGGVSRLATQLYTISYLILFSFLGTLARLGLQALTDYPGAPVFPSVWFNFGGSLVMGFLAEDRMLFRNEWGTPTYEKQIQLARKQDEESAAVNAQTVDLAAAKKTHLATKKTIPLYVGLATGFCGSFTSFSSFIRDIFLALSNDLPPPGSTTTVPRSGGDSFMALLAVIIITVAASLSGLFVGAHLAIASEPITPTLSYRLTRRILDPLAAVLAWGCWIGAVLLTAIPPRDHWRGVATFALVFAPLGTLARFYASLWLNGRRASFPLGTFAVNVAGTAVLGMAWDLQRVAAAPLLGGGVVGCQVLQGLEDGFCGCLTTVSTWVSELAGLRRRHAWAYGAASVLVSFGVMVVVMGGLRWTEGFAGLRCVH